jgi:possible permease
MKHEDWKEQIKWGITAFSVLAAVSLVYVLVNNFYAVKQNLAVFLQILMPIIYGAVLAYLMSPVYNLVVKILGKVYYFFLGEKASQRFLGFFGTVASILFLFFLTSGLVSMLIPELTKSVLSLYFSLPDTINRSYNNLAVILEKFPDLRPYAEKAYEEISSFFTGKPDNTQAIFAHLQNLATFFTNGIWSTLTIVKNILIGLIVMVYLLNMKDLLRRQFRKLLFALFSQKKAKGIIEEMQYVHRVFGGFILGKIIDSIIIGILTFFVLSLMKMPYTLLVSVIVGVTNVIPFFGPFIGAIPCFILILLTSPIQSLYFAIAILIIQQIDGNIIGPKVLGDSTGLSSFWVLFSILLFGGLFGFVGMIIAVPFWAVIMNALRRYMDRRLQKKNLPISSSEYEDFEKFSGKKSDKVAEPEGKEYAKDTDELSKAQIIKDIEAAADEVELSGEL